MPTLWRCTCLRPYLSCCARSHLSRCRCRRLHLSKCSSDTELRCCLTHLRISASPPPTFCLAIPSLSPCLAFSLVPYSRHQYPLVPYRRSQLPRDFARSMMVVQPSCSY
jgi:hypothetical protein